MSEYYVEKDVDLSGYIEGGLETKVEFPFKRHIYFVSKVWNTDSNFVKNYMGFLLILTPSLTPKFLCELLDIVNKDI